jgi:hypothetical protein
MAEADTIVSAVLAKHSALATLFIEFEDACSKVADIKSNLASLITSIETIPSLDGANFDAYKKDAERITAFRATVGAMGRLLITAAYTTKDEVELNKLKDDVIARATSHKPTDPVAHARKHVLEMHKEDNMTAAANHTDAIGNLNAEIVTFMANHTSVRKYNELNDKLVLGYKRLELKLRMVTIKINAIKDATTQSQAPPPAAIDNLLTAPKISAGAQTAIIAAQEELETSLQAYQRAQDAGVLSIDPTTHNTFKQSTIHAHSDTILLGLSGLFSSYLTRRDATAINPPDDLLLCSVEDVAFAFKKPAAYTSDIANSMTLALGSLQLYAAASSDDPTRAAHALAMAYTCTQSSQAANMTMYGQMTKAHSLPPLHCTPDDLWFATMACVACHDRLYMAGLATNISKLYIADMGDGAHTSNGWKDLWSTCTRTPETSVAFAAMYAQSPDNARTITESLMTAASTWIHDPGTVLYTFVLMRIFMQSSKHTKNINHAMLTDIQDELATMKGAVMPWNNTTLTEIMTILLTNDEISDDNPQLATLRYLITPGAKAPSALKWLNPLLAALGWGEQNTDALFVPTKHWALVGTVVRIGRDKPNEWTTRIVSTMQQGQRTVTALGTLLAHYQEEITKSE